MLICTAQRGLCTAPAEALGKRYGECHAVWSADQATLIHVKGLADLLSNCRCAYRQGTTVLSHEKLCNCMHGTDDVLCKQHCQSSTPLNCCMHQHSSSQLSACKLWSTACICAGAAALRVASSGPALTLHSHVHTSEALYRNSSLSYKQCNVNNRCPMLVEVLCSPMTIQMHQSCPRCPQNNSFIKGAAGVLPAQPWAAECCRKAGNAGDEQLRQHQPSGVACKTLGLVRYGLVSKADLALRDQNRSECGVQLPPQTLPAYDSAVS